MTVGSEKQQVSSSSSSSEGTSLLHSDPDGRPELQRALLPQMPTRHVTSHHHLPPLPLQVKHSKLTPHEAVYDDKRVYHAALKGQPLPVPLNKQQ